MNGFVTVGQEIKFARGDHVHPIDTSRAPFYRPVETITSGTRVLTKDDIGRHFRIDGGTITIDVINLPFGSRIMHTRP